MLLHPMTWWQQAVSGGDPYWANVVLLALNENGSDASQTFTDASNSAHALSTFNQAQWDTAQAPAGMTSSALFDGTSDWIQAPDTADWDFGTGDYTVEFFMKRNAANGAYPSFVTSTTSGNPWGLYWENSTGNLLFYNGATGTNKGGALSTSEWQHCAVSKVSGMHQGYLGGSRVWNFDNTGISSNGNNVLRIGYDGINQAWNGWICSVRITKGIGRYDGASLTVPSLPLPTS